MCPELNVTETSAAEGYTYSLSGLTTFTGESSGVDEQVMESPNEWRSESVSEVNHDSSEDESTSRELYVRARVDEFHEQSQNLLKSSNVSAVEEFGSRNGEFLEQLQASSEASCVSVAGKSGAIAGELLVESEQVKDLLEGLQSEALSEAESEHLEIFCAVSAQRPSMGAGSRLVSKDRAKVRVWRVKILSVTLTMFPRTFQKSHARVGTRHNEEQQEANEQGR